MYEIMCGYCRCIKPTGMLTCFRYDLKYVCDKCLNFITGAVKRKSQSSMTAGMQATSGVFSMTAGLLVSHDTTLCAWTFD